MKISVTEKQDKILFITICFALPTAPFLALSIVTGLWYIAQIGLGVMYPVVFILLADHYKWIHYIVKSQNSNSVKSE